MLQKGNFPGSTFSSQFLQFLLIWDCKMQPEASPVKLSTSFVLVCVRNEEAQPLLVKRP